MEAPERKEFSLNTTQSIALDHTIVAAFDKQASATFLTDLFDLPDPVPAGRFLAVQLGNGVTLDYVDVPAAADIHPQHYAFRVSDDDFDRIHGRIVERGMEHWADPRQTTHGIRDDDSGRGTYFIDPSGHYLEILTRSM